MSRFWIVALFALLITRALGGDAAAASLSRVWIDTDAACGVEGRADPDDCFALAYLLGRPDIDIVGISTVFGNASLNETDRITREIVALGGASARPDIPVYRGAPEAGYAEETPASQALTAALESGPMTILALGPLTNLQAVFSVRPTLVPRVTQLVVVMGKREGHLFHPAEGAEGGILFGHGPIFRDFNFCQDVDAVRALIDLPFDTVLIPYEVARQVTLSGTDMDRLAGAGRLVGEIARRSSNWLAFWRKSVGRDGFYPFDLVAAAYLVEPDHFSCEQVAARIAEDEVAYGPLSGPEALMVAAVAATPLKSVTYCHQVRPGIHDRLMWGLRQTSKPEAPALVSPRSG